VQQIFGASVAKRLTHAGKQFGLFGSGERRGFSGHGLSFGCFFMLQPKQNTGRKL
jgi:hypothetical protein